MYATERIQRLPPNHRGTDYVVGDIHGHFDVLETALAGIGFDRACDRLLSVGDLVDRGPESHRASDYLAEPWFFAVRGNHEQMMLDAVGGGAVDSAARALWVLNGGAWFDSIDEDRARALRASIARLPYALTVDLADGRQIGLVHADVSASSWAATTAAIVEAGSDSAVLDHVLWSRARAGEIQAGLDGWPQRCDPSVAGIDRVFFGHTPLPAAIACGNTRWMDTGVFLPRGRLSIAMACHDRLWSFAVDGADNLVREWRVVS